jgi:hypothetical protein
MTQKTEVNIHIDRTKFTSPTPTAGVSLYALGGIRAGYDLFREAHGSGDDEPIKNDQTEYNLHDGDKFYSAQSTLNPGASSNVAGD